MFLGQTKVIKINHLVVINSYKSCISTSEGQCCKSILYRFKLIIYKFHVKNINSHTVKNKNNNNNHDIIQSIMNFKKYIPVQI